MHYTNALHHCMASVHCRLIQCNQILNFDKFWSNQGFTPIAGMWNRCGFWFCRSNTICNTRTLKTNKNRNLDHRYKPHGDCSRRKSEHEELESFNAHDHTWYLRKVPALKIYSSGTARLFFILGITRARIFMVRMNVAPQFGIWSFGIGIPISSRN